MFLYVSHRYLSLFRWYFKYLLPNVYIKDVTLPRHKWYGFPSGGRKRLTAF